MPFGPVAPGVDAALFLCLYRNLQEIIEKHFLTSALLVRLRNLSEPLTLSCSSYSASVLVAEKATREF